MKKVFSLCVLLAAVGLSACNDTPQTLVPDTAPPLAPEVIRAYTKEPGHVTVVWSENTEPDLAGYNVYILGPRTRLNKAGLVRGPQFSTELQYNENQAFRVTAVDNAGNESAPSRPMHVEWAVSDTGPENTGPSDLGQTE